MIDEHEPLCMPVTHRVTMHMGGLYWYVRLYWRSKKLYGEDDYAPESYNGKQVWEWVFKHWIYTPFGYFRP